MILVLFTAGWCAAAPPAQPPGDQVLRERARAGIDLMMEGKLDESIGVFWGIQKADPESPLGDLLVADALWWKIYYATGNLTDPDVFIAINKSPTPDDTAFEKLLSAAITKAEARVKAGQDVARSELYAGMAWGLRGRMAASGQ